MERTLNGHPGGKTLEELRRENRALTARLAGAEQIFSAIRRGEVDALFATDLSGGSVIPLEPAVSGHRLLVEAMHEGAAILDASGSLLYCNVRLADMLNAPLEAVMGGSLFQFVASASRHDFEQMLSRAQREAFSRPVTFLRCNGGDIPVQLALSPMCVDRLPGICAIATDLSEQKRVEAELRGLSASLEQKLNLLRLKNEEVEAFVYIVSHDLRSPLVNIQGFARELETSCGELKEILHSLAMPDDARASVSRILEEDIAGALRFISTSLTGFGRLIDALLELSRLGRRTFSFRQVDAREIASGAANALRHSAAEAGAQIDIGPLPAAYADQTGLSQIFANLIGNAIKYRSPDRPLRVEVGGSVEDGASHYWVRDNGLGIPDSARGRLFQVFQRFHSDRAQGDGMGLAIVHRLVERHQGKVWVESQEGRGSTFHLSLPTAATSPPDLIPATTAA